MKTNKLFLHKLALSVGLVCGALNAQAAINPGFLDSGSSGELFLSVFDASVGPNGTTFAFDTGTTVDDFVNTISKSNYVWNLGSQFASFAGLSGNALKFNVAGSNEYQPYSTANVINGVFSNQGILISHLNPDTGGTIDIRDGITVASLYNQTVSINNKARAIDTALSLGGLSGFTEYSNNASITTSDISNGAHYNFDNSWGDSLLINQWQGTATVRDGSNSDQNLILDFIHGPSAEQVAATGATTSLQVGRIHSNFTELEGYLTLDVSQSTLTWHAPALTAVPLPGVGWLFLSGLVYMLRQQGRKTA